MIKPFLKQLREAIGLPDYMKQIERLVEESTRGCETLATIEKRLAARQATAKT